MGAYTIVWPSAIIHLSSFIHFPMQICGCMIIGFGRFARNTAAYFGVVISVNYWHVWWLVNQVTAVKFQGVLQLVVWDKELQGVIIFWMG